MPAGRILITDGQIIAILQKADRLIARVDDGSRACESAGNVNVREKVKKHTVGRLCKDQTK